MKKVLISIAILSFNGSMAQAQQKADSLKQVELEAIVVSATRASKDAPTAYSNLNEQQIKKDNAAKNIPSILQTLPSVIAYSEDGSGVGNTYFRVRGTDPSRINVTLNGMPMNNPESQDVFWVNLPDLSNSLQSIQMQRGVGTASNGAASFGASLSLQTTGANSQPYASASTAIGSYNTFVSSIAGGTGVMKNGLSFDGRYSRTLADGYIRNGKVDHKAGYASLSHFTDKQLIRLIYINGIQHTGITWLGISPEKMKTDRKYNATGEYKDDAGNIHYYDNDTDNYYSNIIQAIYSRKLNESLTLNANLSYNDGYGYYENYKTDQKFKDKFILQPQQLKNGVTYKKSDIIRQKLMANNLYTGIANINYKRNSLSLTTGTMYSYYDGSHYGKLKWVKYNENIPVDYEWYRNKSVKQDVNVFVKGEYTFFDQLTAFAEIQDRYIDYRMKGPDDDVVEKDGNYSFARLDGKYYYNFFNPKAGLSFMINHNNNVYASLGISNREPLRDDLKDYRKSNKEIKAERLYDYELGYRLTGPTFSFETNLYYMYYTNQLVQTGKLSDSGYRLQENVPESYRLGVELSAAYKPLAWLRLDANIACSKNKIKDYTVYYDLYDNQTDWGYIDGQLSEYIGTTNISFSPDVVSSQSITVTPMKNLDISLTGKYVGKMYYDNTSNKDLQLSDYFTTNAVASYTFPVQNIGNIDLQVYVNNIFDKEYVANAWVDSDRFQDGTRLIGLFPQATRNFMCRVGVRF